MFGLTQAQWAETGIATAVVLGSVVAAVLASRLLVHVLRPLFRPLTHANETLDALLARAVRMPLVLLVGIWVAEGVTSRLSYVDEESLWTRDAAAAATVILVALAVQRVAVALLEWQARRSGPGGRLHPGSLPLLRRGTTLLIVAIGLLIALDTLDVSISPLLAGLGIGGIAVALAVQPLLANVFASSYMLSDSSIRIGDFVAVEGGPSGVVDDIGWRATRVRTWDNNIVIMPNSALANATVTNFTLAAIESDARIDIRVPLEEDLERVEGLLMEELTALRDEQAIAVKDWGPLVRFIAYGDSHIETMLKLRANSWGDAGLLRHLMMMRVHRRLADEGVAIGYPTRRLLAREGELPGMGLGGTPERAEPFPPVPPL